MQSFTARGNPSPLQHHAFKGAQQKVFHKEGPIKNHLEAPELVFAGRQDVFPLPCSSRAPFHPYNVMARLVVIRACVSTKHCGW